MTNWLFAGLASFCQFVEKPVFSAVKTGLAKIVFASKTNFSQNFFLHFFQLKVCYLHNIFLITCYLFNCWHRV